MELVSNIAVTLKASPKTTAAYQASPTNVPIVLGPQVPGQNNGVQRLQDSSPTDIAVAMPVQLGARLRLIIPYVFRTPQTVGDRPPLEPYRYRPFWRLRGASGTRLAHNLPEPSKIYQATNEVVAAWAGADLVAPAQFPPPLPWNTAFPPPGPHVPLLLASGSNLGTDALQAAGDHPFPWWSVELECEGDEFGLLVVPEAQQFGAAPVGIWDFAAGATNEGFGQVYSTAAVSGAYNLGAGIAAIVGTRSP